MAGKIKLSFHARVFITLLALFWTLTGAFMVFQYNREKEFKAGLLDTELQMHNRFIIDRLRHGDNPDSLIRQLPGASDSLRISIIGADGTVVADNNDSTPFPTGNHNSRPEIMEARKNGTGYSVGRHSASDNADYFYSARLGDGGIVVRSAAPYNHNLRDFLRADRSLLWLLCVMTLALSFIGFFATRKISLSIKRLNSFAEKAENGGEIFNDEAFPNDELGSIASHIVRLYVQRDKRHREAMEQQREKEAMKKRLTNNINHELKTPVASILACLELLRDHPELPPEKKDGFTGRIYANAQRLDTLLKDVAEITRMDEGGEMIEKCPVDIAALIGEIAAEARLRTDMEIHTDVPPMTVCGNRGLLESVFRNLIDNAIAYSGGTRIDIRADADGTFTVCDNGSGVAPEHLPHLFERFYRVDKGRSRASGGTGLGLAIVRNAIAIHGGSIRIESAGGLKFIFTLNKNLTKNT